MFNDHRVTCIDDDECAAGHPNDCDPNAECTNLPGSYKCKCKPGFESPEMMGYHCVDIDECSGMVFSKSRYIIYSYFRLMLFESLT